MRRNLERVGLALAFAAATVLAGWWTVVPLAVAWGFLRAGTRGPAREAALAAALAWALLLAAAAVQGPVAELAAQLGSVFQIPAFLVVLLTLAIPALLAGSAAGLAATLRQPTPEA